MAALLAFTPTAAHAQFLVAPPIGGVACDAMEGQRLHIHQHLTILDHGKLVAIPDDVGRPTARNCLYWLHTHTPDGIIHIEAPVDRSFTLGTFMEIWRQPLSRTQAASARLKRGEPMRVWVDGARSQGDPRAIKLASHTDIVIEVGPPFATPSPFTAWNGAN
jgi:hypothetical protein